MLASEEPGVEAIFQVEHLFIVQLGATSSSELTSVLCSRREVDEARRLQYQINPTKHR